MGTRQFIDWLNDRLDRRTFRGCVWVDKDQKVFKISWPRADRSMKPDKLEIMFDWWTHKFGNTRTHNQPTAIKGNFRSCLNSKVQNSEIKKLHHLNTREGENDWKFFQFTDHDKKTSKPPKQERPPSEVVNGSSTSEIRDDTQIYEPPELYPEEFIDLEANEVEHGARLWRLSIKIFKKDRVLIQEYIYDFNKENNGENKLHFHVAGNEKRMKALSQIYKAWLPQANPKNIVPVPINPSKNPYLTKQFPCPSSSNPNNTATMSELFCPGFILEVDKMFNVYITRISQQRTLYGHHGETQTWQKLESPKPRGGGIRQLVFSYPKFVHRKYVYSKWLDDTTVGKPKVEMIHPVVIMPVSDVPALGSSYTSGEFFFEIEHLPAQQLYKMVEEKRTAAPSKDNPNASEDHYSDLLKNLNSLSVTDNQPACKPAAGYHSGAGSQPTAGPPTGSYIPLPPQPSPSHCTGYGNVLPGYPHNNPHNNPNNNPNNNPHNNPHNNPYNNPGLTKQEFMCTNGDEVAGPSHQPQQQHQMQPQNLQHHQYQQQTHSQQEPLLMNYSVNHNVTSPPSEVVNGIEQEIGSYPNSFSPISCSLYSPLSSVASPASSVGSEAFQAQRELLIQQGLHPGNLPSEVFFPQTPSDRNLNEASVDITEPNSPWSDTSTIVQELSNDYQDQGLM